MSSPIKAIETKYKGYRFRSRTEARWAVFFDAIGIPWSYEVEPYNLGSAGCYLPDFVIPYKAFHRCGYQGGCQPESIFVEIKGTEPTATEIQKMVALISGFKRGENGFSSAIVRIVWCVPGDEKYLSVFGSKEAHVRRLSWSFTSTFYPFVVFDKEVSDGWATIQAAINKARSARFDHGETPQ